MGVGGLGGGGGGRGGGGRGGWDKAALAIMATPTVARAADDKVEPVRRGGGLHPLLSDL